jgi:hypothetical protein
MIAATSSRLKQECSGSGQPHLGMLDVTNPATRGTTLMQRKTKWIAGAALAGALIIGGIGAGTAQEASTDDDQPLSGETYDKATAAALEETKGGTVTDTEMGDDGATYGVEVLLEDGRQVEVNLDQNYKVTGQEADDDSADDDGADDD